MPGIQPLTKAVPPRVARTRARKAAQNRHPGEDDTELRRELAEAKVADYIEQALAASPPLLDEQRSRLADLLKPAARP